MPTSRTGCMADYGGVWEILTAFSRVSYVYFCRLLNTTDSRAIRKTISPFLFRRNLILLMMQSKIQIRLYYFFIRATTAIPHLLMFILQKKKKTKINQKLKTELIKSSCSFLDFKTVKLLRLTKTKASLFSFFSFPFCAYNLTCLVSSCTHAETHFGEIHHKARGMYRYEKSSWQVRLYVGWKGVHFILIQKNE